MYLPQIDDERNTLCGYLEMQLDAIRASAYGIDDEAARRAPVRSVMSISGIIKHVTFVMSQSLCGAKSEGYENVDVDFHESFTPTAEEPLEVVLERFDKVRADYMTMCRDGDLEAELPVGPFPWYGMEEPRNARLRYLYLHAVEEFARHAGHADIIREELDGAKAAELLAATEGLAPNHYVTPWGS